MTEFATAPDGVRIAYESVGAGEPVVLVHGFGASRVQNWRTPGWYDTLTGAGYQVIALDCRGHGESDKPHDVAAYAETTMANDVAVVMQAARVPSAFVMGYSMGGAIVIRLAYEHPQLVRAFVVGGVGSNFFSRSNDWRASIADGLTAADATSLTPAQRTFRDFASQPGKDVLALAACMRAPRFNLSIAELTSIEIPALVVCGETDEVSGPAASLTD